MSSKAWRIYPGGLLCVFVSYFFSFFFSSYLNWVRVKTTFPGQTRRVIIPPQHGPVILTASMRVACAVAATMLHCARPNVSVGRELFSKKKSLNITNLIAQCVNDFVKWLFSEQCKNVGIKNISFCCYYYYYYYYYYYFHHYLLYAGYLYIYSWDKPCR